jgi:hypothetical protein
MMFCHKVFYLVELVQRGLEFWLGNWQLYLVSWKGPIDGCCDTPLAVIRMSTE